MRVLVTGGTGFVGRHLIRALSNSGATVFALCRESSRTSNFSPQVEVVRVQDNLTSVIDAVRNIKPDVVVHLASYFVAEHTTSDIEKLLDSNLRFGLHLLEAMSKAGVRALVNTGTAWQHFEQISGQNHYLPVNLYAATKQAFEDLVLAYAETEKWAVVHLKLHDTYGPGDERPKLIPKLVSLAKAATSSSPSAPLAQLALSPGEQKIDLVHIDDVCAAFSMAIQRVVRAATSQSSTNVASFAVSSGTPLSLREIISLVEKNFKTHLAVEWGARPYRNREVFNPWRGQTLPGWQPQVTLDKGLKDLLGAK